jgi:alpha-galactosidase
MRFGVHLMRGIPRLAVERNLPVMGTQYHARDIANTNSVCTWNKDMYGVDMKKPGAQEYYNSVFKLFAEWGVDFVKMDDMSRPYGEHYLEIEAAHKAILASGRPMILSLSPGETDIKWAAHVQQYAQMWRISDDFWDDWKLLKDQFQRLKDWTPWRGEGSWPDADMLPLGLLALGKRQTRFTPAEQTTLMTLWAIARSPLIMGGDLRALDEPTLALLTNEEVIAVNQHSIHNRARYMKNDGDAYHYWTAEPENGKGLYLALFNLADQERFRYINLAEINMRGKYEVRDLWAKTKLGEAKDRFGIILPPHGAGLFLLN